MVMPKANHPAPPVLKLSNKRMLLFMKFCVDNAVNGCDSENSFLSAIGFEYPGNLKQLKEGAGRSFTIEQLSKACEVYGADANFFLLEKHTKMFLAGPLKPAYVELMEATVRVGIELNKL